MQGIREYRNEEYVENVQDNEQGDEQESDEQEYDVDIDVYCPETVDLSNSAPECPDS